MEIREVLILIFILIIISCPTLAVEKGDRLPNFELQNIEGETVQISDYQDQYVLYEIWARWCQPCLENLESYQKNIEKFKEADVKLVGVSVDATLNDPRDLARKRKITFPIIYDKDRLLGKSWDIRGIPTSLLVNPQGVVVLKIEGAISFSDLWRQISSKAYAGQIMTSKFTSLKPGVYSTRTAMVDIDKLFKDISDKLVEHNSDKFMSKALFGLRGYDLKGEPKYSKSPLYATINISGQVFVAVGIRSEQFGFIDKLYVDFNGNMDLTDDGGPINMERQGNFSYTTFNLTAKVDNRKVPFKIECNSSKFNSTVDTYLVTGYKGQIATDTDPVDFVLLDKNINGRYNDLEDALLIDLDGNGICDANSSVIEWVRLDQELELGLNRYKFKVEEEGKKVIVKKIM